MPSSEKKGGGIKMIYPSSLLVLFNRQYGLGDGALRFAPRAVCENAIRQEFPDVYFHRENLRNRRQY